MSLINGSNILGNWNIFRRGNDRYINTPSIGMNEIINLLSAQKQEISIDGNESEIYKTTPHLRAVIYRRAQMLSNGKFKHMDKNGNEIENSPFVARLNAPNPIQSGKGWLIQQDIQKSLYANNFIYFLKGSRLIEVPNALWNISPDSVTIERTGKIWNQTDINKIVKRYLVNAGVDGSNPDMKLVPAEVLHRNIQSVDDPLTGVSPLHALKMPISNLRAAYGFRNVIMTKKGALGIITNKSKSSAGALPLTKKERQEVEDLFAKDYGLSDKQRKILVTSADLSWQAMSYPTKDLMLFDEVNADFEAIIDEYGTDKALFSRDATFENKLMGERATYNNTIIPEAEDLANDLTNKFKLNERNEKIILDYSHVAALQEDEERKAKTIETKAKALNTLLESGLYSLEEIREIVNF